jgi:uncharacterized protein
MDAAPITLGPAAEAERILALDALRGLGVMGILVMNIQSFSTISAAYINPTAVKPLQGSDLWMWLIGELAADEKFMAIFSMLFGAGIALLTSRIEARGSKPTRIFLRRCVWLMLFGILHAYLLWSGDILYTYGVCGLLVYPLRRMAPRRLLAVGLLVVALGSALSILTGWSMKFWDPKDAAGFEETIWRPPPQRVATEIAAYRDNWKGQMRARIPDAIAGETSVFLFYSLWRAAGLMLVGMALYKWGVLTASRSARFYLRWIIAGALIGFPLILYGAWRDIQDGWSMRYSFFFGSQFNYWGSLGVAMAWIGLVMLGCRAPAALPAMRRLGAVGRMAFSNYILETVICTTIFYGHGLGLFARLDRVQGGAIVVAVWIFVFVFSQVWMRNFSFGPLEWLWRSLTYLEREPFRRRS